MDHKELFEVHCGPKFEKMEASLERIESILTNGLTTKVALLEESMKGQKSKWKWIATTTTAIALILVGAFVRHLL